MSGEKQTPSEVWRGLAKGLANIMADIGGHACDENYLTSEELAALTELDKEAGRKRSDWGEWVEGPDPEWN